MKAKRGVICSLAALAVLLAVVVIVAQWDMAKAATFNPTLDVTLSDDTAGANADVTYDFRVPGGDANYDLNISFTPVEFGLGADIPLGAYVADLDALTTLGLLNNPCQTALEVPFAMLDASLDTSDTVSYQDSYIDLDGNTLPDGVDKYPDFLNTLFPGLTPTARMFGATSAAGVAVIMNMVIFEPGTTLYGIEFDAALGRPSVQVLNDPTLPPNPTPITDFCTPLSAVITTFGVSKTDSEVTPVEGGDVVSTNPTTGGDYTFNTYTTSLRDADGDGLDNSLDTCPYDFDTGLDDDYDGLDNVCDPEPAVASAGLDEDGDGYMNRGDNCPLDANPDQADADDDDIGDDCDDHPNDADAEGESIEVYLEDTVTITGGVPPDESPTPTPTLVSEEGALENCPQPNKWAISVWSGDDGTDAEQAFATCGEGAVIAAYALDPETQAWSRWFAGQPEISNLLTLDNMQGVIALGGAGVAAAASAGSCVPQVPPEGQANLFHNAGFESGEDPWCTAHPEDPTTKFQLSQDYAHSGEWSALLRMRVPAEEEGHAKVFYLVQEVVPEQFPELISGYYRVENWTKGTPKQYLQFVVIAFGATNLPGGYPNHQIRYPLAGISEEPFAIANAFFVFIGKEEPRSGQWVYFERNIKQDFEELWGAAPEGFDKIRVIFEVRYDDKEAGLTPANADVYYDDVYIGPASPTPTPTATAAPLAAGDAMQNCPQAGKWAIAVWDGDDGTDAEQAFGTCGEGAVIAAYALDPETQAWSRWFAGRPEISNLTALDNMQGVIALGGARALKIGLLVPYTGALSDFGEPFANAAKLAVKEINEAGGVLGQDVVLVTGDSGTEPVRAQQEARRLVDIGKVSAIVGAGASGITLPVAESVTVPSEIVQISPASTSPALTAVDDDDFLFRTTISDAAQGLILAHLADDLGFTSACTMYVNDAYGQGLSEQFAEAFEELGGTVTAQVSHATEEQVTYLLELSQCVEGNPEVLAAISYPEHAGVYLKEALEQALIDTFLFVDGTKSDAMFEELGWDNFEGMYGTAPGALETAAGTAFANAYEAEYGEPPALPFMRETYDAVYVIALAAAKANSTDSTAIRNALRDIANPPGEVVNPGVEGFDGALTLIAAGTDIDYQGASGPIDFDPNGDVLQGAIEIWQIAAGEIVEAVRTFAVDLSTTPPTVTEVTE